jgi:hypothetical protein
LAGWELWKNFPEAMRKARINVHLGRYTSFHAQGALVDNGIVTQGIHTADLKVSAREVGEAIRM